MNLRDTNPSINDGETELLELNNKISFENLNFEYVKDFPVLKNINIEIEKGKTTAIVGSTGSGKSTLIKLILRFYEKNSGKILFDEHEIESLSLESIRNKIGLVSQDVFLFEGKLKTSFFKLLKTTIFSGVCPSKTRKKKPFFYFFNFLISLFS